MTGSASRRGLNIPRWLRPSPQPAATCSIGSLRDFEARGRSPARRRGDAARRATRAPQRAVAPRLAPIGATNSGATPICAPSSACPRSAPRRSSAPPMPPTRRRGSCRHRCPASSVWCSSMAYAQRPGCGRPHGRRRHCGYGLACRAAARAAVRHVCQRQRGAAHPWRTRDRGAVRDQRRGRGRGLLPAAAGRSRTRQPADSSWNATSARRLPPTLVCANVAVELGARCAADALPAAAVRRAYRCSPIRCSAQLADRGQLQRASGRDRRRHRPAPAPGYGSPDAPRR